MMLIRAAGKGHTLPTLFSFYPLIETSVLAARVNCNGIFTYKRMGSASLVCDMQ